MSIGEKITMLRTERGIYQKELATYLKVSIATISNYEKGIHSPDLVTLGRLADFFGVTTDYLLGRTNYRYDPTGLNRHLVLNYTIADLVNTTLELSEPEICSVMEYVELLRLRSKESKHNR